MDFPLLTVTMALPLVAAFIVALLPADRRDAIRWSALGGSLATFVASLFILFRFEVGEPGFQLVEKVPWIPAWGITYEVGVDGITLPLVLLSTFIIPIAIIATWDDITDRVRGFYVSVLVLETFVLGVFVAMDLILFYVFFEVMLVPMYALIGIWGGARRRYAAVKFFLYTFVGGLLMLTAILYLFFQAGGESFAYETLLQVRLSPTEETWLFLAFLAAFAIKVPLWPVHTWLPDAHTEAPTVGSVDLAAILLKIGGYGIIRFLLPFFPNATRDFALPIVILAVIGVVYGAIVAMMQSDIKRLVAYSSVSHMGFVVLGVFALTTISASGSVVQMINHGLSTGALFILVGFMYQRTHSRQIAEHSGMLKATPVFGGLFLVVALSSLALPGLNGFVGEFPILLGGFETFRWPVIFAAFGMVLAALYLLWAYQRMFHGPVGGHASAMKDLNLREVAAMAPLIAVIVWIGVYPKPLYDRIEPTVEAIVEDVQTRSDVGAAGTAEIEPSGTD